MQALLSKRSAVVLSILCVFVLSAFALLLGSTVNAYQMSVVETPAEESEVTVYRFFNMITGAHLYTISIFERDTIINNLSDEWLYEGPVYTVLEGPSEGAIPVYRFFNTKTGTHLFTIDESEKETVDETLPQFEYEGIKYYVYATELSGTSPIYRLFNEVNGAHLYTNSSEEYGNITENLPNFDDEGVKFYVKPYAGDMAVLTLEATVVAGGIEFEWETRNWADKDGFKLVKSEDIYPVYPGDEYQYFSDVNKREYKWSLTDGQTYHFRVCRYVGGTCDIYSNDVQVTAPTTGDLGDGTIVLQGEAVEGGIHFNWVVDETLNVDKGFKLVKSTGPNPVYPGSAYQYLSNPETREHTWSLTDGQTYHFRVCRYLGGSCDVYSNDIVVTAPGNTVPEGAEIVLEGLAVADGLKFEWTTENLGSFNGYKVVASTEAEPTYPEDGYVTYISNPEVKLYEWDITDGETYHVRVCRYANGVCDVYSNEVVLTAPSE